MKEDSGAYYIENVAILPAHRRKGAFGKMLMALREELRKRGIFRISMHARVSNGLSKNIQENMKMVEIRRIDTHGDTMPMKNRQIISLQNGHETISCKTFE